MAQIGEKAKIETGGYIGSGSNSGTVLTLSFSFEPKIVVISGNYRGKDTDPWQLHLGIFQRDLNASGALILNHGYNPSFGSETVTWEGNALKTYAKNGAYSYINFPNGIYRYTAFG